MKKLLTLVVSLVLLLTIACKDKKDAEEATPVEAAPAIEEVAPAETAE